MIWGSSEVHTAIAVGLVALVAALVSAWVTSRSIGKRLTAIARAAEEQISAAIASEKGQRDALVRERTAQLVASNEDLRFVLDHVGQGFFTVAPNGSISRERSAITETWLGTPRADATLAQWVGQVDRRAGMWMQIGWNALSADVMPMELSLDQLPKTLTHGEMTLAITYSPIMKEGALARVLVVLSDVTSAKARERSQAVEREFQAVLERVVRDKVGFVEFLDEATELICLIDTPHIRVTTDLRRAIHTLKGNCAIFGLGTISEACHVLEDSIAESNSPPTTQQRTEITTLWSTFTAKVQLLTSGDGPPKVETDKKDYDRLLDNIASGVSRRELLRDLLSWTLEPTNRRLTRLADQARSIAARLGKPELLVSLEDNDLRVSSDRWAPFWSAFTHVIRNAVDHGIEPPDERLALGKLERGTLSLRTFSSADAFIVEVEDDGRGIDWSAVAERARALGLPASNDTELAEVIFADGMSTKHDVSQSSGRGVGLGAARAECIALGGTVSIQTVRGVGTCFHFAFPETSMIDDSHVARERADSPRSLVGR